MIRLILFLLWQTIKCLFILLPLMILGWILLPVLLLVIPPKREDLPALFRPWDNFSGPEVDGLAGDVPFRVKIGMGMAPAGVYRVSDLLYTQTCGYWKLLWRRYVWLAWRNPVDYTKGKLLGYEFTKKIMVSLFNEGSINHVEFNDGSSCQEVYYYGKPFSTRIRIGYKCDTQYDLLYQSSHPHLQGRKFLRWEYSITPFKENR